MGMTIDEEIKHCEEIAEKNEKRAGWFFGKEGNPNYQNCVECASEHRQLAESLQCLQIYPKALQSLLTKQKVRIKI